MPGRREDYPRRRLWPSDKTPDPAKPVRPERYAPAMRSPDGNAVGQTPGRRHGSSGQNAQPQKARPQKAQPQNAQSQKAQPQKAQPQPSRRQSAQDADGRRDGGEGSLFAPGYRGDRGAAARPGHDSGRHPGWSGLRPGAAGRGPVRGYPPLPGQPPPLYPPGQFAAWNRTAWPDAGSPASGLQLGYSGYSVLAVSDPTADETATQTWAVIDVDEPASAQPAAAPSGNQAGRNQAGTASAGPPPPHAPHSPQSPHSPQAPQPAQTAQTAKPKVRGRGTGAHSTGGHNTGGRTAAGNGAAGGTAGGSARGRSRTRRRARWLVAACLAIAVVLGAVIYFVARGSFGQSGTAAGARHSPAGSASRPAATPSLGRWGHIATRAIDPVPLTLGELFPARFTVTGVSYRQTVKREGRKCSAAVIGAALQRAVKHAGCSQVLRASYLSPGTKLMGTIGVLNLRTFTSAQRAGEAAGRAQFIAQLPAATGPTRKLTSGTGIEEADIKGHYLILVWGEFTSLRAPKTKAERMALEKFLSELINKTVNLSLTRRMVNGTAATPS